MAVMLGAVERLTWVVSLLAAGCAATNPPPPAATGPAERTGPRVVVLPALWMTSSTGPFDATQAARRGLLDHADIAVVDEEATRAALAAEASAPACAEDLSCVRRLGLQLRAQRVLVIRLAQLGTTVLVRLSTVDPQANGLQVTSQSVVHAASDGEVAAKLRALAFDAGRPLALPKHQAPPRKSWYEHWWTWAIVGVLAAGSLTALLLGRDAAKSSPAPIPPDVVVTPP